MYGLGGTCPTPGVACASSELKACMASAGIANRGRSSAPVPAVNWVTLGSLWPWCTSPGQWLSWPKGDGVKCSRSERPRRESRNEINETHAAEFIPSPWTPSDQLKPRISKDFEAECRSICFAAESSQASPSQAKPRQAKPSQYNPSQPKKFAYEFQ